MGLEKVLQGSNCITNDGILFRIDVTKSKLFFLNKALIGIYLVVHVVLVILLCLIVIQINTIRFDIKENSMSLLVELKAISEVFSLEYLNDIIKNMSSIRRNSVDSVSPSND